MATLRAPCPLDQLSRSRDFPSRKCRAFASRSFRSPNFPRSRPLVLQVSSSRPAAARADASLNGNGHATEAPQGSALIMMRHGESLWNSRNLFTGNVDVPLSQQGVDEAIEAGKKISHIPIDVIFTSALIRAQMTAMLAMTQHRKRKVPTIMHRDSPRDIQWSTIHSAATEEESIPVVTAWQLNERMYGELQGLNKRETADKYGDDMVQTWRRSFDVAPPGGESLEMCAERSVAYFQQHVEPLLTSGRNVMIAAHGNSLRAIIMYLDQLTSAEVIELELATGVPMLYTYKPGVGYQRRGSPHGVDEIGVYALTEEMAQYRNMLDQTSMIP